MEKPIYFSFFPLDGGNLRRRFLHFPLRTDNKPYEIPGNGDGTVPIRSLEGWRRWVGKQQQFVNGTGRPGVNHMTILSDKYVIAQIVKHSLGNK